MLLRDYQHMNRRLGRKVVESNDRIVLINLGCRNFTVRNFAKNAKANGFGVLISIAGMAAHLGGVLAANTTLPIIGVPGKSSFEGLDALLATVQMPSGIPVATVAVNGSKNAAILAAQMLALSDSELDDKLVKMRADMADEVRAKDAKISAQFAQ